MQTSKTLSLLVLVVVVIGGVWLWWGHRVALAPTSENNPVATVAFACDAGKNITAVFYKNRVELTLSDGRNLSLPQTLSADGGRYSDGNPQVAGSESLVFWEKGNGAFVEEGTDQKQTYTGCVAVAPDPGTLPQIYSDGTAGYSFRYPAGYTLNTPYTYQELGPGRDIKGVKVTIPASMAAGTNLSSSDTGVSIEQLPNVQECNAALFFGEKTMATSTVTDGGTTYSYAKGGGGAAGNLYEEDVYALPGTSPCTAVRYLIHSTQLANYPAGTKTAFDRDALIAQFDAVRRTLTL